MVSKWAFQSKLDTFWHSKLCCDFKCSFFLLYIRFFNYSCLFMPKIKLSNLTYKFCYICLLLFCYYISKIAYFRNIFPYIQCFAQCIIFIWKSRREWGEYRNALKNKFLFSWNYALCPVNFRLTPSGWATGICGSMFGIYILQNQYMYRILRMFYLKKFSL